MYKKLLIIGFIWPEPLATAAGSRMMQLIEVFQKNHYQIIFVSTATRSEKSFPLETLGIETQAIALNDSDFDKFLKQINPDIVLFDRYLTEEQFGWRVEENCKNALRILDTEDLHFLRYARHVAYKNKEKLSVDNLVNDHTKRELASIYRCDLSLIISKFELDLLINTFKVDTSILLYLPFLLENINQKLINSYPAFKERKNFMTIGNFKHEPNWQALKYLKNTIWPLIRKEMPDVELHIYGAYATDKVKQLHKVKEGFIVKGWVASAEHAFKYSRICLAPLQFGAGLKGKLIDAMNFATPSVTTSIGAEAMHDDLPWNGFIRDDITEFVERSVELYRNEELWNKAQENGITIINQCFDKNKYANMLIHSIDQIQNSLNEHRLHNFIGSMLQYHSLKSTKYMSKWIEEKNKP